MAAAVNNIAATFSSSGGKISSKQPTLSTSASLALNNASVSSFSSSPIVAWNPQAKLPRSDRSSFVSLYGGPGPKHKALLNLRAKPLRSSPKPTSPFIRATISVGDKLPEATLSFIDHEDNLQTVTVSDLTRGEEVVLFAVPGAFTPTCSNKHLPGFVEKSDELKGKGVDTIACISVNDAFVMKAWGEDLNVEDKVLLLADGNGEFTKAMGVTLDFSDKPAGLGVRSRRYALLAVNGVVKVLKLEEGGAFTVSGAEDILKAL